MISRAHQRVALYSRFSSDLQNPRSADDQLAELRRDLGRRFPDWEIVREEKDEARTGTSLDGRDGLARLRRASAERPRPFDLVVVEDVSRLARNRGDALRVREGFTASGVSVLSMADGYVDPDSDAGLFVTGIKELKAEADSRETGRRVRRGVSARTRRGWLSGRKTPFGYLRKPVFSETERDRDGRPVRIGVTLEPDPVGGPAVTHLFERYAAGIGFRRICRELNDPQGVWRAAKPEGFVTSFVRAVLLNPVYRGAAVYGRTREVKVRVGATVKRRKVKLPPDQWVVLEDAHPALVDRATWDAVQAIFAENKRVPAGSPRRGGPGRGGNQAASALTGLVRCGTCAGALHVRSSFPNKRQKARGDSTCYRKFACSRRHSSGEVLCTNRVSLTVDPLEQRVLEIVRARLLTEEGLLHLETRRREVLLQEMTDIAERAPVLEQELEDIRKAERRIVLAIEQGLQMPEMRNRVEVLRERRKAISQDLERLELLREVEHGRIEAQVRRLRMGDLQRLLDSSDRDIVRQALRRIIDSVEVREDGAVTVHVGDGALPEGARREPLPAGPRDGSREPMVGATGFEPATSSTPRMRASQAALRPDRASGRAVRRRVAERSGVPRGTVSDGDYPRPPSDRQECGAGSI